MVHLVDAHLYVFRAYHSLPPMEAPDGTPTNAAYGFAGTLIKLLSERAPGHAACCFDFALTSFRNELFPDYKASRGTEPPPDLEPQFALCKEVASALGLPVFEREGYEADDVIATLCARIRAGGGRAVVVSGDKDLAQLVTGDDGVVLLDLARERTLDAEAVRARFGVEPARIPDWLALVGDASDDLPGVPGFGPKRAAAALAAFGALEAIPEEPDAWKQAGLRSAARLAAAWATHREQALRVRDLATVVRDVPGIAPSVEALAWRGPDREAFEALATRLGWRGILRRLPRPGPSGATSSPRGPLAGVGEKSLET
ncbi:MAG: 5'-3' exonuclease H3TH domain-containing protein [Myxococcota bacterium]|nr:5'-3' exonuclease H3TH domain-containing protein [Myxococcota bacterium]